MCNRDVTHSARPHGIPSVLRVNRRQEALTLTVIGQVPGPEGNANHRQVSFLHEQRKLTLGRTQTDRVVSLSSGVFVFWGSPEASRTKTMDKNSDSVKYYLEWWRFSLSKVLCVVSVE